MLRSELVAIKLGQWLWNFLVATFKEPNSSQATSSTHHFYSFVENELRTNRNLWLYEKNLGGLLYYILPCFSNKCIYVYIF